MIVIVDYGMGNVGSILNMLKHVGARAEISSAPNKLREAGAIILPGVGAFDAGMQNLESSGLRAVLDESVLQEKTPVLGVCLGMQLLTRQSEEGNRSGLGWIAGETVRWRFEPKSSGLKIPHMGWNTVAPSPGAVLFSGFATSPRFYFVHSYHVVCEDPADVAATVHHGYDAAAAVAHGNIHGVQFHPEKSHKFGMKVLQAFVGLESR